MISEGLPPGDYLYQGRYHFGCSSRPIIARTRTRDLLDTNWRVAAEEARDE